MPAPARRKPRVLLLTPPMVQLNTPYPAVPVLAGFLRERGVPVRQVDLSLKVALRLFTPETVREAAAALARRRRLSEAALAFREQAAEYEACVAPVVAFLQGRAPELAWRFAREGSLPVGPHFRELDPDGSGDPEAGLDALYGPLAVADRAKLRASLFLGDLAAALAAALDPDFALARYAERLAVAAPSFSPLLRRLRGAPSRVDRILEEILGQNSIPFLRKNVLGAGMAIKVGPMLERGRFYVPYELLPKAQALVNDFFSEEEEAVPME